ncbi:MAG: N-acetyl-gamma-glutamyl-phosphate reductase [bacterium]
MITVGIIGATGYTGMELIRILLKHPKAELAYATSRRWSGQAISDVMPHLYSARDLVLAGFDAKEAASAAELFFVCLPHGESMNISADLYGRGKKVIDLSADFRLRDPAVFGEWYGEHTQPELLSEAVYGLPELYREEIGDATLIANPGCYPVSVILALIPLLEEGLVSLDSIVADSKSGVSGAGREPKPNLHFPEVYSDFSAYSIAGTHRHISEMEQELGGICQGDVKLTFTPHLLPVSRGILTSIYASPSDEMDEGSLVELYRERYSAEPFVIVRDLSEPLPGLKDVCGTNQCILATRYDERTGKVIVISVLDNLVKGAAGLAIQNMNLMLGFGEDVGLTDLPLYP